MYTDSLHHSPTSRYSVLYRLLRRHRVAMVSPPLPSFIARGTAQSDEHLLTALAGDTARLFGTTDAGQFHVPKGT